MNFARFLFVMLFFAAMMNYGPTSALAVPQQFNYQGSLTDPSGTPLDTTVAITFNIWPVPAGGSPDWTETHATVTVQEGLFAVQLGSVTTLPDLFAANRWLGITIGGDTEMIPRQQIVSVAHAYRVGTVDGASGGTISGQLNVGSGNSNAGTAFSNVFGQSNSISSDLSVISGGAGNSTEVNYSVIGGGQSNQVFGNFGAIGGGSNNQASGIYSTVSGGYNGVASGALSTVGGGNSNAATGYSATIGGGDNGVASGTSSTVSGGYSNEASLNAGTVSGGYNGAASGAYSTVGGGYVNTASGNSATVAGGYSNEATDGSTTVSGGGDNTASAINATVGGGYSNNASGYCATIPGGFDCSAIARYAFAAGANANANDVGAFVWADSNTATFSSAGINTFNVRASGGIEMWTNAAATVGVTLLAADNTWNSICDSTLKTKIKQIEGRQMLDKISELPIYLWHHKDGDPNLQHIGPMAQDFWNAFHVGGDSLKISTIDPSGVALAAIQELAKENLKQDAEIQELKALVQTLMADKQQSAHIEQEGK